MRDDEDRAVGLDAEIDARMERGRVGLRVEDRRLAPAPNGSSGTSRDATTNAPVERMPFRNWRRLSEMFSMNHHARSFAAVWMAARMR